MSKNKARDRLDTKRPTIDTALTAEQRWHYSFINEWDTRTRTTDGPAIYTLTTSVTVHVQQIRRRERRDDSSEARRRAERVDKSKVFTTSNPRCETRDEFEAKRQKQKSEPVPELTLRRLICSFAALTAALLIDGPRHPLQRARVGNAQMLQWRATGVRRWIDAEGGAHAIFGLQFVPVVRHDSDGNRDIRL